MLFPKNMFPYENDKISVKKQISLPIHSDYRD